MLNKENIIKIIKDMNLPIGDFWISSGAALVIHGVKEYTRDIDLGCNENLWNLLLNEGYTYRVADDNSKIMALNDSIELIKDWFADEIEFIEGLPVCSLDSVKKQKLKLGREKDSKDIKLIEDYIISKK
ncbi:MAG: hypothetical protein Q8930_19435 [Bacillota bacterium]|nr:hypothetical protein [Bacillota bacterium]